VSFSLQDSTCSSASRPGGRSLLNVQLAQKLLRARELEAFQTMAAFSSMISECSNDSQPDAAESAGAF